MPPVAILEHPGHAERLWPLSVEAYHALGDAGLIPERTELLYGFVFNKMPKSPLHSALVQRLRRLLELILSAEFLLRQEQPIVCGNSEPEPDLAVIVGKDEDYWDKHPTTAELVIEVAVTSEDYDRDKATAYATAGVKEFWIVLVPEKQIEIYRDPQEGVYRTQLTVSPDENAVSIVVEGFAVIPGTLLTK